MKSFLTILIIFLFSISIYGTEHVVNGDFEADSGMSMTPTGWSVGGGSTNDPKSYTDHDVVPAHMGHTALDLGPGGGPDLNGGWAEQTINLTIGKYILTFWYSSEVSGGYSRIDENFKFSLSGILTEEELIVPTKTYKRFTKIINVTTAGDLTIRFTDFNRNYNHLDPIIDDVSLVEFSCDEVIPDENPTVAISSGDISFDITGTDKSGTLFLNSININGNEFSELIGPDDLAYSYTNKANNNQYVKQTVTINGANTTINPVASIIDDELVFKPAVLRAMNDRNLNHYFANDPYSGAGIVNGDYADYLYSTPIKSAGNRYFLLTERGGNNLMDVQALDSNGNLIGNAVSITPSNGTYVDTGVDNENGQDLKVGVFPLTALVTKNTEIYGLRVTQRTTNGDGGDSKIFLMVDPLSMGCIDTDKDGIIDEDDIDDDNDGILDTDEMNSNLVVNGSFEANDFASTVEYPGSLTSEDGTFIGADYNNYSITGWNHSVNMDGWVGGHRWALAKDGNQYMDILGNREVHGTGALVVVDTNELTQEITTQVGKKYKFSFYWGEDVGHQAGERVLLNTKVISNGTNLVDKVLSKTAIGSNGTYHGPNEWFLYETTFVATSTHTQIYFKATPPGNGDLSAGAALDFVKVIEIKDSDHDGIEDYLDLDSDNDGILDNIEAQVTVGYITPSGIDANFDGLDDIYGTGLTPINTDSTDNPDYIDIDSDNDGVTDLIEGNDTNHDGIADKFLSGDTDHDGLDDIFDTDNGGSLAITQDTDNDGNLDYRDLDDDGDGILNSVELNCAITTLLDLSNITDSSPNFTDIPLGTTSFSGELISDGGISNSPIGSNSGNFLIQSPNNMTYETYKFTFASPINIKFSQGDADPFWFNDAEEYTISTDTGILSITDPNGELGSITGNNTNSVTFVPTKNGGHTPPSNSYWVISSSKNIKTVTIKFRSLSSSAQGSAISIKASCLNYDTDNDGIPNYLDLDSDNDGILDNIEAQGDNYTAPSGVDLDQDGVDDAYAGGLTPENTDGVDNPDYLDTDSDNDGVTDLIEGNDANHDGIADKPLSENDTDHDGLDDIFDPDNNGELAVTQDTDGDTKKDYRDIDDDNDTMLTKDEDINNNGNFSDDDTDSDGAPNYLDSDTCGDGINLATEACDDGNLVNTDGCSSTCTIETGYACNDNSPSVCTCDTNSGYQDNNNNGTCELDCAHTTCDNNATCNDGNGTATCTCNNGYSGNGIICEDNCTVNNMNCDDGNECTVDSCSAGACIYNNEVDGTACGDTNNKCTHDTCVAGVCNPVATNCSANSTCTASTGICDCDTNYQDNNNDGSCELDCAHTSCNQNCSDATGTATCSCNAGYTLENDGHTCNDIDECTDGTATCDENAICTNNNGGYDCQCKPGYQGDGQTCTQSEDSDNDGIPDVLDLDDDNDGIPDTVEEATALNNGDTDNDGIPDSLDKDSDNDGINDVIEADGVDTDNDGKLDDFTDVDQDGLADSVDNVDSGIAGANEVTTGEPLALPNSDNDAQPDFQDIDDDNDGILTKFENPDVNNDGNIDDAQDTDNDGVPDYLDIDDDNDGVNTEFENPDANYDGNPSDAQDTDNDGVSDYLDIDDDDDGINTEYEHADDNNDGNPDDAQDTDNDGVPDYLDSDNNGSEDLDTDNDGIPNSIDLDDDNDGIPDSVEMGDNPTLDTDGDGTIDSLDLDSDNDGINDVIEAGGTDIDHNGKIDNFIDVDNDGLADSVDNIDSGSGNDEVSNGEVLPTPDRDNDGKRDFQDSDDDNDGILTKYENPDPNGDKDISDAQDTDTDGIPDYLDPDDDGDTILTVDENADPNGDGNPNDAKDSDDNGVPDYLDPDKTIDTDNDGVPNYLDLDDDNDGIPDSVEMSTSLNNGDTDNDGIPDSLDLDSDNDGINDVIEAGGTDTDHNGKIDNFIDVDNDGLADSVDNIDSGIGGANEVTDGDPLPLTNSDNDNIPDFQDVDDDNDGILTKFENPDPNGDKDISDAQDTDTDGRPDYLDSDDDNDSLLTKDEHPDDNGDGNPNDALDSDGNDIPDYLDPDENPDTDGDGIPNSIDLDSDNDGIPDSIEMGDNPTLDTDNDGIIDSLDSDSDNDGVNDIIEGNAVGSTTLDTDNDGRIDNFVDVDNDGLADSVDNVDSGIGGANEVINGEALPTPDSDNDGKRDFQDTDDDGDGIDTKFENPDVNNDGNIDDAQDTDDDGVPDYLDPDDDDDSILTKDENADPNGDGNPDDALDDNNNGKPNYLDPKGNIDEDITYKGSSLTGCTYNQNSSTPFGILILLSLIFFVLRKKEEK